MLRAAGYRATVLERSVAEIDPLLLPVVLLLDRGGACVLREAPRVMPGLPGRVAEVVEFDHGSPAHRQVPEGELAVRGTGFVLVATPERADPRLRDGTAPPRHPPQGHWLWGTLRRFVPYYRSALLAALISNVLMLATGLITSVIYDKVIPHQAFVTLWALAIGSALAIAIDMGARQLRNYLIDKAGRKVDVIVGATLFRQTLSLRMEHRPGSAGTHSHQLAQLEQVREFFASVTLSALSDLPFVLIFVAMVFVVGGPLGWVLVVAVPTILGLALAVQSVLRRSMRESMRHQADLQGLLVESVEGLEDLKAAGAEGRFLGRFEASTEAGVTSAIRARAVSSWTTNLSSLSQQIVTLVLLVWGVYLIEAGTITSGALIGSVMFATRAVMPLASVVMLATRYQGVRASMLALDRLMDTPVDRDPQQRYVSQPRFDGAIALVDAGFSYPAVGGNPAPPVLRQLSLRIAPGERVVVLGRIGSGKSTLLRLLAGLYRPTSGMVEVGGMDLRQIDPADFRAHVGFVSQEPRLFFGSLRENVLLGRPGIDAARLAEVAALTGLDRVVAAHPLGWELPVGEMGSLLSGGQRQLVALARCLVTRPSLLLMDEPTSSMDAQSEALFLKQLARAAGRCTLVMVTHRPAVLELADRIVVIDNGKLSVDGPKAPVLAMLSGNARPAPAAAAPADAPVAAPAAAVTPLRPRLAEAAEAAAQPG